MSDKSLYEHILSHITNEKLSEDFPLPDKDIAGGLPLADGVWDGIIRYHVAPCGLGPEGTRILAKALHAAAASEFDEADSLFCELGKEHRAIAVVDSLQTYLIKHIKKFPAEGIYQTAVHLVLHSKNKESVKFGIEMLELFTSLNEQAMSILRNIGLCEEFTLFVLWALRKRENGNEEIFSLAQRVHGWGKIHAVDLLSPDTEEIKDWLLLHGVYNDIQNAYSALMVWEKADVPSRLLAKLTDAQFSAVADTINALLEEGPVPGISHVAEAETHLMHFLEQASERDLSLSQYEVILNIRNWSAWKAGPAQSNEEKEALLLSSAAETLLTTPACLAAVQNAVNVGKGLRLARALGIPFLKELYRCLEGDFSQYCSDCGYLMASPDYVDATVKLFEERLPLNKLVGEPSDQTLSGENAEAHSRLTLILQELADKPLVGTTLLRTGLRSADAANRNTALQTLLGWTKEKQQPLFELSGELYEEVTALKQREVHEAAMEKANKLLNNEIPTWEEEENE